MNAGYFRAIYHEEIRKLGCNWDRSRLHTREAAFVVCFEFCWLVCETSGGATLSGNLSH